MPIQKAADYGIVDTNNDSGAWKEMFKQQRLDGADINNITSNENGDGLRDTSPSIRNHARNQRRHSAQIDDEMEVMDLDSLPAEFLELRLMTQAKCDEVDKLRRAKADRFLVSSKDEELLRLKIQYFEQVGTRFPVSADNIAYEFVYNYYDVIDYERHIASLMPYYHNVSAFTINGHAKFLGSGNIMKAIMANFSDLAVSHTIRSVELDPYPPKRCVMYLKAHGTLVIQDDRPRQFIEIFELNYSNKEAFGASKYFISNQIFTITDSRPLYSWPAMEIPVTHHDNTEPNLANLETKEVMDQTAEKEVAEGSTNIVAGAISGVTNWMRNMFGGETNDKRDTTNFKKKKFHPDMFNPSEEAPPAEVPTSRLQLISRTSRKHLDATLETIANLNPLRPIIRRFQSHNSKIHDVGRNSKEDISSHADESLSSREKLAKSKFGSKKESNMVPDGGTSLAEHRWRRIFVLRSFLSRGFLMRQR